VNTLEPPAQPEEEPPALDEAAASNADLAPGLVALARRLQAALTPVEPRPAFLAQLAERLAAARPQVEAAVRQKEQRLMWVAGVGGALYLAGLGFISLRAAQAVGGRLAALVTARGARPAVPGAPTAT